MVRPRGGARDVVAVRRGGAGFRTGGEPGPVDTVAFGAYRRGIFDEIGGFAEDIDQGEDDEFNYRLLDAGGTIILDPAIRAFYTVRGSPRALWRQYFGYGRAKPEVLRRHPTQARRRQLAPPAFVASLLLFSVTVRPTRYRTLRLTAAAYAAAVVIATLLECRRRPSAFPALPVAFACLHLAYGFGFLAGLEEQLRHAVIRSTQDTSREGTQSPT